MIVSGPIPEPGVGEASRGAGPGAAFDVFAREQRQALVAFAWTLTGDVSVAEDVAQDALHATWQAWDRGAGIDHPGAWARQVIANRAVDRVRRAGRERRALGLVGARPDPGVDLPTTDHDFWDAVRALPERQAQAIALRPARCSTTSPHGPPTRSSPRTDRRWGRPSPRHGPNRR